VPAAAVIPASIAYIRVVVVKKLVVGVSGAPDRGVPGGATGRAPSYTQRLPSALK